ncbi:MAG: phosphatidylglycerophosphatase A [Planctomycetaceae bacterium]|nr:phosphatidylglycerophosphatase A [Planctomycetaceae bacterium]
MSGLFDRLVLLLATGLGVGRMRWVPGTFGSLWGLAIAAGLEAAGWSWPVRSLVLGGLCLLGVPICGRGAKLLGLKDPGPVVYDEFVSLPLAYLFVPFNGAMAILGFLFFRCLDMTKPWPLRWLERLPGGWGIMADDMAAGLLAGLLLWLGSTQLGWF